MVKQLCLITPSHLALRTSHLTTVAERSRGKAHIRKFIEERTLRVVPSFISYVCRMNIDLLQLTREVELLSKSIGAWMKAQTE
ncbi:MAG: hypothetical protein ACKOZM_07490, partial [Flavobacteriales bacterium]